MNSSTFYTSFVSSRFSAPLFARVLKAIFGGEFTQTDSDSCIWKVGSDTYFIKYDAATEGNISRLVDRSLNDALSFFAQHLDGINVRFQDEREGFSKHALVYFYERDSGTHIGTVHLVGSDASES